MERRTVAVQYNEQKGIQWEWQAMDGAMTKAPLGKKDGSTGAIEEGTGPNPTDRGKSGTKRSLLTDGAGIPLAVVIAGANRPDCKMAEQTLSSLMVERPKPTWDCPQHMCMDAGYDGDPIYQLLEEWGYIPHIRSHYDEKMQLVQMQHVPGYRARRWVVERTHSWLNRFRRLLIRWEKKVQNYTTMMHLACAFICFRAGQLFG